MLRKPEAVESPASVTTIEQPRQTEAVAALGQLQPAGEVRRLAAPASGMAGSPRVTSLRVKEGDVVTRGQVLAVFDNRPQIEADLAAQDERIRSVDIEIPLRRREVARYAQAARVGAATAVLLEEKQDELTLLQRKRVELLAERRSLQADLNDSELRSPINGVVLKVHTREGERPDTDGVLEVGASQSMEALIEVYESDINRIAMDERVTLISENGGFEGELEGQVAQISPQVRQRQVLSTDPTGDADARVVEVLVRLDAASAERVARLAGLKVIARFQS
ncbi:HlyD family efflux transporter periplasmic adaptor subunit [Synechococcus sp. NOUM97013]|uniref:HlyD family efflux transporter periplasmic adaptor subunit n=1 Tax=Synechococcus sp. NOUM97013 TaxID=1442555 RepID=UPI0016455DAC|nr:HlyD family efflux transporter periplasmic adaptor subunit [Synechococcus sp. NOUM97013]